MITIPPEETRNERYEEQTPLAEQRKQKYFYHFCVRPFFALLHILYTLIYYMKRPFVFWRKPRAYYVSFGSTDEYMPHHLVAEAKQSGLFHHARGWTPDDLADTKFWRTNGDFCLQTNRGFGYWCWKPYVIMQTYKKMRDGDILLYTDAGSILLFDAEGKTKWQEMCAQLDHKTVLAVPHKVPLRRWCKYDTFAFLRKDTPAWKERNIIESNTLLMKKSPSNYHWLRHWQHLLWHSRYRFLVDDSPSHRPNAKDFRQHRHDQSILSLLIPLSAWKEFPQSEIHLTMRLPAIYKDALLQGAHIPPSTSHKAIKHKRKVLLAFDFATRFHAGHKDTLSQGAHPPPLVSPETSEKDRKFLKTLTRWLQIYQQSGIKINSDKK